MIVTSMIRFPEVFVSKSTKLIYYSSSIYFVNSDSIAKLCCDVIQGCTENFIVHTKASASNFLFSISQLTVQYILNLYLYCCEFDWCETIKIGKSLVSSVSMVDNPSSTLCVVQGCRCFMMRSCQLLGKQINHTVILLSLWSLWDHQVESPLTVLYTR